MIVFFHVSEFPGYITVQYRYSNSSVLFVDVGTKSASSLASAATDAASDAAYKAGSAASNAGSATSETLTNAWYAATDAPNQAYDYMTTKYDQTKDYVYSTWSDAELKKYLVDQGIIKSDSKKKRDELLKYMKDSYDEAASNVYDTCKCVPHILKHEVI